MRNTQQEIATPDSNNMPRNDRTLKRFSTKWLAYTAVFSALALIMKFIGQFLTLTPSFKLTLIYTVWLIAGAVLNPIGGACVCFISDVLGALIFPTGSMNPLLTLGNTLYGLLAGLSFRLTPSRHSAVKFFVSGLVCTVVCTCLLNSLSIWYWYHYYETLSFWQYFIGFRLLQPAVAAINIAITIAMIPLLNRVGLMPQQKIKSKKEKLLCRTSQSKC